MKIKVGKVIDLFFMIVCLFFFIFSLVHIINWKLNNRANKKINEITHEYITVGGEDKYKIDFDKLKDINSDVIGYIRVNGTNIDYVVVQGKDNEYYLSKNLEKKDNKSGWIFLDYKNKLDGTDKNIIIYGHNTVDKSMFGSLKNVLKEEWFNNKNNHEIVFVTESGLVKYKVFSTYKIDNEEFYIKTDFTSDEEYKNFIKKIKKRSYFDFDVDTENVSQILTLSTCSNQGKKRVVLHAIKVDEEIVEGESTNE